MIEIIEKTFEKRSKTIKNLKVFIEIYLITSFVFICFVHLS